MTEIFTLKFVLEFLASIAAIITVWVYGNKNNKAPIIGMIGQMFWWVLTFYSEMWGLIPLNVVMLIIHIRNYFHMKKLDFIKKNL
jgi:hypothetical protein